MGYAAGMSRWQPDAPGRLNEAALALYDERGYDATTVADIAERAGLTKRTFFRHFADKREVLFWRSEELERLVVAAVAAAPADAPPLDAVAAGLDAAAAMFEPIRDTATRRQRVIASSQDLRERELIKLVALADATAAALRDRSTAATTTAAALAAEAGIAVFRLAFERWTTGAADKTLAQLIDHGLSELRAVVTT